MYEATAFAEQIPYYSPFKGGGVGGGGGGAALGL